jgi:hypothetical protein
MPPSVTFVQRAIATIVPVVADNLAGLSALRH